MKDEFGQSNEAFEVNLTRQQLSEFLGIRVETVIRTVKQLQEDGDVKIIDRKIFR
nr:helix-turn-helix domain-containing protein [Roseivirga sp. E12]